MMPLNIFRLVTRYEFEKEEGTRVLQTRFLNYTSLTLL
jgi:hypothetical protein